MICCLMVCLLFLGSSVSSFALNAEADSTRSKKTADEKKIELSIMPYLSYNRNLKLMLGVIPMGMYRLNQNDTISPKSLSGLAGIYTTNGSYFFTIFNKFYLAEDRWRITFFAGGGDHFSQYYLMEEDIDPGFYDYDTKSVMVSVSALRRITTGLFGGLGYTYANHHSKFEDDVQDESWTKTHGLEFKLLYDKRNAVYYPTSGIKTKLRWTTYPEFLGNDIEANKLNAEYNQYFPMKNGTDVVAARFAGKFGLGDIAFEQQSTIGQADIRGYTEGKYRGDGTMAVQSEYRYNRFGKIGLVGFLGLATLYGSDTSEFNWDLYPGGGVGVRYQAFKTMKFNVGLDAAWGKDDWGIYFRIGEAF